MIQSTRITTNISSNLLKFADSLAEKRDVTRRDILEESLEKMQLDARRRELVEEYNKMADDKELMGEWLAIANDPVNLVWND